MGQCFSNDLGRRSREAIERARANVEYMILETYMYGEVRRLVEKSSDQTLHLHELQMNLPDGDNHLYNRFVLACSGNSDVLPKFLFHGTPEENHGSIFTVGLKRKEEGGAVDFWFSEDPAECAFYARSANSEAKLLVFLVYDPASSDKRGFYKVPVTEPERTLPVAVADIRIKKTEVPVTEPERTLPGAVADVRTKKLTRSQSL